MIEKDPRWLLLGDSNAAGQFFYGVITTGIYCRPGCPSRRPNPDNVRFFDSAQTAESAGFRPCKRCRPQHTSAQTQELERVAAICRYIENTEHQPNLAELAEFSGWSSYHLQRVFKKATGVSPKNYTKQLHKQRETQAAVRTKSTGNIMIEYAISSSTLGKVLIAWSPKGICAILIDDNSQYLVNDLRQRFQRAEITRSDNNREAELQKIIAFIEHPETTLKLPLDIQGTLFQQRVWHALQQIPSGETRSYSDIATAIGSPNAVRAVASACAANSIAVVIPCHRVVRQDGNLSGYRWGIERKQTLLDREEKNKGK